MAGSRSAAEDQEVTSNAETKKRLAKWTEEAKALWSVEEKPQAIVKGSKPRKWGLTIGGQDGRK